MRNNELSKISIRTKQVFNRMTFTSPLTLNYDVTLGGIDKNNSRNKGDPSIAHLLLSDCFSKLYLSDKRAINKWVFKENG